MAIQSKAFFVLLFDCFFFFEMVFTHSFSIVLLSLSTLRFDSSRSLAVCRWFGWVRESLSFRRDAFYLIV